MTRGFLIFLSAGALLPVAVAHGAGKKVLGAPSYDHATETTHRAVTWADFQGTGEIRTGEGRWQERNFAHIATTLRVSPYDLEDRQDGDEWVATAVGVRPYAVMNKDFSGAKHGTRSAYTLAHEQLHFDIAEAFARRHAVELAAIEGRGDTRQAARVDLARRHKERLEAVLQELFAFQDRYDLETDHGSRKKKQKKWAAEVPEMLRQATEALVAHREQHGLTD